MASRTRRRTVSVGKMLRRRSAVPLRLGRELGSGETGTGYLSGLAARNRVPSVREFFVMFSESSPDALSGEPGALRHFAARGGVSPDRLAASFPYWDKNAGSLAGHAVRKSDMVGESVMKFCPACLADDVEKAPDIHPDAAVAERIFWRFAASEACPMHGCALVEDAYPQGLAQDFSAAYRTLAASGSSKLVPIRKAASGLDRLLHDRFHGDPAEDSFWADQEVYEIIRSCLMIGAVALHGRDFKLSALDRTTVMAMCHRGFDLLDGPREALYGQLDDVAAGARRTSRSLPGATKSFGKLGIWASAYAESAEFYKIRQVLARYLVDRKLVRLSDKWILGLPAPERSYGSLISLSSQFGTSERLLRQALTAAGYLGDGQQSVADSQVFVEVEQVREFLDAFAERMNKKEVADCLGIDDRWVLSLVRAGYLRPSVHRRSSDGKPLQFFARSHVEEVRTKALEATRNTARPEGTCTILFAARIVQRPFVTLLGMVLDGRLRRLWKVSERIDEVHVDVDEINELLRPPRPDVYSVKQCHLLLRVSPEVVSKLLRREVLPQSTVHRPSGLGSMRAVPSPAVDGFRRDYVSVTELNDAYRIGVRGLVERLARFGIEPAFTSAQVGTTIYDRLEVTSFLNGEGMKAFQATLYKNTRSDR